MIEDINKAGVKYMNMSSEWSVVFLASGHALQMLRINGGWSVDIEVSIDHEITCMGRTRLSAIFTTSAKHGNCIAIEIPDKNLVRSEARRLDRSTRDFRVSRALVFAIHDAIVGELGLV